MKRFVFIFLLLAVPAYGQNDLQGIREQTRILLGEITPERYSDPLVDSTSNRAIRECALLAGVLISEEDTLTTALNQLCYSLNADFWRVRSVWLGIAGVQRTPLVIVDEPYTAGGIGLATLPTQYCWVSKNTLCLWGLSQGAAKIHVFYYRFPRKLSAATDTTDIPYMLRPAIPYLAASFLAFQTKQADLGQIFYTRGLALIEAWRTYFKNQGDRPEVKKP